MAEFAIRSLATMAERNPSVQIPGHVPQLGYHLEIYNNWLYFAAVLGLIIILHATLSVAAAWISRRVVVIDDSFVAIARLLNGTTPRHAEGQDQDQGIAGTDMRVQAHEPVPGTTAAHNSGQGLVYGPLSMGSGNYVLQIAENIPPLRWWPDQRHPDGTYIDE